MIQTLVVTLDKFLWCLVVRISIKVGEKWLRKHFHLRMRLKPLSTQSMCHTILGYSQCSQMTFSKIRTNTAGKIRTYWKNSILFFDTGIKLKDFLSTIELGHTFLNLTILNYFININHIFKCNSIPYTHTVI